MTNPHRSRARPTGVVRSFKRVHLVMVRVSEQEINRLYNAAADQKRKLSTWIRERALEAAERRKTPRSPCGG